MDEAPKTARNGPTEVVPGRVWLGPAPVTSTGEPWEAGGGDGGDDDNDYGHMAVLHRAGVTHIVNCTPTWPFVTAEQLRRRRRRPAEGAAATTPALGEFRVAVEDVDAAAAALGDCLDAAADFMQTGLAGGGRVYVHCETGKSRSAAVVLAYRVKYLGETLREAYDATKGLRGYIQPRVSFFQLLAERERGWLEAYHAREGSGDGGDRSSSSSGGSFSVRDYALVYLLDHFAAYSWVEGIDDASIRAAWANANGDYAAASGALQAVVSGAF